MASGDKIKIIKGSDGDPEGVSIPERTSRDPFLIKLMGETKEVERDAALEAVFRLGSLALLDDRISAFLEDADGQIASRFEQLKVLHDLRRSAWERGSYDELEGENVLGSLLTRLRTHVIAGERPNLQDLPVTGMVILGSPPTRVEPGPTDPEQGELF